MLRLTFFIITDPTKVRGGVCCAETAKHTVPTFTFARHDAGALSEPTFAGTGPDIAIACLTSACFAWRQVCHVLSSPSYAAMARRVCLVQKRAVRGHHAQAASVPCSRWSRGGTDGWIVA